MGKTLKPEFTHRTNEDGSVHSYCSRCFATIADSSSQAQLQAAESEHKCDARLLEIDPVVVGLADLDQRLRRHRAAAPPVRNA